MARIDNLENFLTDVAKSIKDKKEYSEDTKIPAADFDSEIASIEGGIDLSDATAEINDVISPKVFYNSKGRQSGGIFTSQVIRRSVSSHSCLRVLILKLSTTLFKVRQLSHQVVLLEITQVSS